MEIKVNDYVRTDKGTIDKITDKNIMAYQVSLMGFGEKPIKSSSNIGKLLKVGDFIDGMRIVEIEDTTIHTLGGWFIDADDVEDLVTSIVTKEMFEQMEYKIN